MQNKYFIIEDKSLINKIEELLRFDKSEITSKVGPNLTTDYLNNKNAKLCLNKDIKNQCYNYYNTVSKLRRFLFTDLAIHISVNELDECIDDYLYLLRIDKQEALLCLDRFLNVMLANISTLFDLVCFKRLICVFSVIFQNQIYRYGDEKKLYSCIFYNNIEYLKEEDKNFLIIFLISENRIEELIQIITSYSVLDSNKPTEEIPTHESAVSAFGKFKFILKKYSERAHNGVSDYNDVYNFIDIFHSSHIGKNLEKLISNYTKYIEHQLLKVALLSKNTAELLRKEPTLIKFSQEDEYSDLLFYYAQFYKTESKGKENPQREKYLDKAKGYIEKAIDEKKKALKKGKNTYSNSLDLAEIILEKSCILAEMEKYNDAYRVMISVINNPKNRLKKWYNSTYYYYMIWISAQYLSDKKLEKDYIEIENAINDLDKYINHYFWGLKEFTPIVEFANDDIFLINNKKIRDRIYSQLLALMSCANRIIEKSRITEVSNHCILYYTRAENLRLLLEDEKDSEVKYRLPLFHANHMNDPEEGKVFKSFLKKGTIMSSSVIDYHPGRQKYEENYVFLKSFFICEKDHFNEFLPMWVQYGNDAKGLCILLNESTFQNVDLLRVNYLNDIGKCENNRINSLIKKYKNVYREIMQLCETELINNNECIERTLSIVEYITSQIIYLFKHDSYKHENEARIIVTRSASELEDVRTISGNVPKLFLYSSFQTYIDEIILGSKMEIPDNYVPFIHFHGKKMWHNNNKKNQITVSKSEIQYR